MMVLITPKSPMSTRSSQSSVPSNAKGRVSVYRHEPYAASLITPASATDAAFVCCHRRGSKSLSSCGATLALNTPSSTCSIGDAALSITSVGDCTPATSPLSVTKAPAIFLPQTPIWVAFKYGRKPFVASFAVRAGELVVVEGDRGVDCGIVDDLCLMQGGPAPLNVLRRASAEDEARYAKRTGKELEAVRMMRALAMQVNCPAHVEDAMFQLDGKKVTVVISRTTRTFVDFRRLQRALFDAYRCRIWFAYLDEIQETMSTEVSQPIRRTQHRRSAPEDAEGKKMLHGSVTSSPHSTT